MSFLPEGYYPDLGSAAREALDSQFAEWSRRRDAIVPFIGEHAATLFGCAIADENDAAVTSVYFRKVLIDSGENPDAPTVTEAEQLLIDWGRLLARNPTGIPVEFRDRIDATFSEQLRARLTEFATLTIDTNLLEAQLDIVPDPTLASYRGPRDHRSAS